MTTRSWMQRKHHHDDKPDLTNLTDPLIVVIAALLFFLASNPLFLLHGNLPQVKGAAGPRGDDRPLAAIEFSSSEVKWNGRPIDALELARLLERLAATAPQGKIALAGDPTASYGQSVRLRQELTERGFRVLEVAKTSHP